MLNTIIQSIIAQRKICYFVSPHFDDAILSAGALISYLSRYTKIVIINVFTKAGEKPYTLSAKTYLKQCGYTDAEILYKDREQEDAVVFNHIADEIINLGFVDALWRKKYTRGIISRLFNKIAELQVLYPLYKFHITKGVIARQDFKTLEEIKTELQNIVQDDRGAVFCPFGIGNHIDHVITRRACDELYRQVIYWSDYPYDLKNKQNTDEFISYSFEKNLADKHELIKGYQTQYTAMFGSGFQLKPEIFLSRK